MNYTGDDVTGEGRQKLSVFQSIALL